MLLTNLPLDLIHNLFLMLDDRRMLAAFLSTNRHLHQVFTSHPNSILRQVVCNEIGMDIRVLPYAWASIRSQYDVMPEELMETQLEIASQDFSILSIEHYAFQRLRDDHATVREFTKHYSIRCKEGRILRDTLTAEESRRFQIAAHLFLHYQTIWSNFQEYALEYSDDGDEFTGVEAREDPVQDAKTMDACRAFLWRLPTEELLWIQEFRDFLLQDMDDTLDLKNNPTYFTQLGFRVRNNVTLSVDAWRHFLLSTPRVSLGGWGNVTINIGCAPTRLHREELWLTGALSRVLHYRGVRTQADDEKILKSKGILIPACQKCGECHERGQFINTTSEILTINKPPTPASAHVIADLEYFPLYWSYCDFPGQLSYNLIETRRALKRIHSSATPSHNATQRERLVIIREIMEHAEKQVASSLENGGPSGDEDLVVSDDEDESDQANEKTPVKGDYKWSPDDVLCPSCFATIFTDLYYAWWLDERQTDRVEVHTFPEGPCWWGKECRTQRREDHARRRDHCCPRTRDVVSCLEPTVLLS